MTYTGLRLERHGIQQQAFRTMKILQMEAPKVEAFMNLLNFELSKPSFSIELVGLDCVWDLHNAGKFIDIRVSPGDNSALMRWSVTSIHAKEYMGCNLRFVGLRALTLSPRDDRLPYSEDLCISGISKVTPEMAENPAYRTKRHEDAKRD
jgi:hypothetical protein